MLIVKYYSINIAFFIQELVLLQHVDHTMLWYHNNVSIVSRENANIFYNLFGDNR